jgi:outer membrane receptor protein involved in Fe transport
VGAELSAEQDNNNLLGDARPIYSFGGVWNFANDAPLFEGIAANPRNGLPADAQTYLRSKAYALFFQDDWKVKPNLTLNLGLRYEYFAPLSDAKGQLSNLVKAPGGILADARVVPVERLVDPDRHNFGPRLGFAWSPGRLHSSTVLRGGYGITYNRPDDVLFTNARANPPRYGRFSLCCGANKGILYALGSSNSPTSYPANLALVFGISPTTGGVCGDAACTEG